MAEDRTRELKFNGLARYTITRDYGGTWQRLEGAARITACFVRTRLVKFHRAPGRLTPGGGYQVSARLIAYKFDGADDWTVMPGG